LIKKLSSPSPNVTHKLRGVDFLALRNAEKLPADPIDYLQEFFAHYNETGPNSSEGLREEQKQLTDKITTLENRVTELTKSISQEVELRRLNKIFPKFTLDKSVRIRNKL